MCGIAGIFGVGEIDLDENTLNRMIFAIRHRGPDGSGIKVFSHAGFAHVRLAIIDIEGGVQPMSTADGRYHIIFNGEIYNYREIREDLEKNGVEFLTTSDTEVILKSFQKCGIEAVNSFRGMFAFAIWDEKNEEGYLVRDSYGIKPLFWKHSGKQLIFGSEIKALLPVCRQCPDMDTHSLHLLMNFRYIPGDATLFEGVQHLPPGSVLHWTKDKHTIKRWVGDQGNDQTQNGRVVDLQQLLQQAVTRQLVSDVPIGAYLSGGMDSATIVALASKHLAVADFPTFTIQVGDDVNEAPNAKRTAELFKVLNHQEAIESNFGEILPRLIYHLEVPKVNAWQSALVAQLASQHVKVALSGLGGDEIFLGYNIHSILARLVQGQKAFGRLTHHCGAVVEKITSVIGISFEEFNRGGQALSAMPDVAAAYGILRNVWDSESGRQRIYGPRLLEYKLQNAFELLRTSWSGSQDAVMAAAGFEIKNKMANDLLLQEDRLSMAFGLEVRVPFLDEDLVRYTTNIASVERMKGNSKKALMKETVGKWLPQEILSRPKSGFQLPIHETFQQHLRPLCERYLSPARLKDDGLFNPKFVEEILLARPHLRLRWHYFLLYLMIGVNIWQDIFLKQTEVPKWN